MINDIYLFIYQASQLVRFSVIKAVEWKTLYVYIERRTHSWLLPLFQRFLIMFREAVLFCGTFQIFYLTHRELRQPYIRERIKIHVRQFLIDGTS